MVVRGGHRHDLLGADLGADVAEAHGVGDRAGGDDRAVALHQARNRCDRADAARVRELHVGAGEIVGGECVVTRPCDQVVERGLELGERLAAGVANNRHHQGAAAVLLLNVDRDAEVDGVVVDASRLAVDRVEVVRHDGHLALCCQRDGVGDQVCEGDLLAGVLELLAAPVHGGDGDGAERGRGRDLARVVHVAGEHRGGALEHRVGRLRRATGGCGAVGGGQHVVFGHAAARASA